ncbi:MAG: alpha/beta hydrolase [Nocardioides sp.]
MALLSVDFFSDVLEVGASMNVVWPQTTEHQVGVSGGRESSDGPPVLYLLHGRTDDHSAWCRNTSVERYAVAAGVAVVMPAVARSFYTDEVHGDRYWTFLSQELPALVGSMFRVSQRREDTFVAGLSMGGYGAMKWALREPHRFAAAATMSGALDIPVLLRDPERRTELVDRVFGPDLDPAEDLFALLGSADADRLPRLHVSCGTEDHLVDHSRRFAASADQVGVDVTIDFRPGEHEWGFWDTEIQQVLDWLPLPAKT